MRSFWTHKLTTTEIEIQEKQRKRKWVVLPIWRISWGLMYGEGNEDREMCLCYNIMGTTYKITKLNLIELTKPRKSQKPSARPVFLWHFRILVQGNLQYQDILGSRDAEEMHQQVIDVIRQDPADRCRHKIQMFIPWLKSKSHLLNELDAGKRTRYNEPDIPNHMVSGVVGYRAYVRILILESIFV